MPTLGISRVTDITRMDRLGLPVFASIRPRGLALCVNAGKGATPLEAEVGALMEAVEFAAAEPGRSAWQGRTWRLSDLQAEWASDLRLSWLAPRIGQPPAAEHPTETVRCEDLGGGRAMWLPAELIFMPFGNGESRLLFGWSSNGLASGNTLAEATLHAVLEVLERDAMALNMVRDESFWLPTEELPPHLQQQVADWQQRGFDLALRYVPNAFGLPCFQVLLHEGDDAVVSLANGTGMHFEPGIALARALYEAAQSRLSHIHGGRDDVTHFYATHGDVHRATPAHETLAYREAFDTARRITWAELPSLPCHEQPLEALLDGLIARLLALGFRQVFRHRFDLDLAGLHVVKVVIPGCEAIDRQLERMGPRLYAHCQAMHA